MNYIEAGVDIELGDKFVDKIKKFIRPTYNKKVVSGVGGFCALYEISKDKWLAAGTDGVGTKVKLATELNIHNTIGQDLVAMCVNDIICSGATPSFFLDYLATSKLSLETHSDVVEGIAQACIISECALIGGETAEMPGVYHDDDYDLAGFSIGELNPVNFISGKKITNGCKLVGIRSSGFHSNGFSLVRKLLNENEIDLKKEALVPTRLYWPLIKEILNNQRENILGIAHITGGGFYNIPRMNEQMGYVINNLPTEKDRSHIMNIITARSNLNQFELYKTFNMGIGLVLCVENENKFQSFLNELHEPSISLGYIDDSLKGLHFSI